MPVPAAVMEEAAPETETILQANMKHSSKYLSLGDALTLQRGFDLPSYERKAGGIPVVTSSGPSGTHSHFKVTAPGVVTGRYGTIGQVFFLTVPFWPLNTTLWVKDFKGNDERFVYYLLQTVDFASCSDKSSVPGVNRNHLHTLPISLPPLPEQRAIAHILGTLDDKIELNRRTNETLEAMARALFKSWFVDFDPVRRNIERRRGKTVSASGGMSEMDALFPDSFVDSELGRIPRGWRVASLPTVIQVNPRVPLKPGAVAPYLDMKNMPTAAARAVGVTERPFSSGSKFLQGDTLVARITPCLENGKTAYVDFLPEGVVGTGSTEFIVLRPVSPLTNTYGYFMARTPDFRKFAISNMTGTSGRQRVQPNCLQHFTIVVASQSILMKFGKFGDGVLDAMRQLDDESATLATFRDALLPKLLSGEIRIKAAEKFVEAVA